MTSESARIQSSAKNDPLTGVRVPVWPLTRPTVPEGLRPRRGRSARDRPEVGDPADRDLPWQIEPLLRLDPVPGSGRLPGRHQDRLRERLLRSVHHWRVTTVRRCGTRRLQGLVQASFAPARQNAQGHRSGAASMMHVTPPFAHPSWYGMPVPSRAGKAPSVSSRLPDRGRPRSDRFAPVQRR